VIEPSDDAPNAKAPSPRSADILAALLCATVGLILAIAPHLAALARYGTLEYLGDGDDVFYLAVSRAPYYGEPALRDPLCPPEERVPTLYAWLQFVPLAVLTRSLVLGPILTALVWRAVGGPLLGLALYGLFRRLFDGVKHPVGWSLWCALVCLADGGFNEGRSLFHALTLVRCMAGGTTTGSVPNGLGQYRVVTPLLNLPAFLVLMALLVPPRKGRRSWVEAAVGAVALGLCVQLYFFYWTAAVVTVGLVSAGWLAAWRLGRDNSARVRARSELVFAAAVLIGGLAIGAPQVIGNTRTFADPKYRSAMERMCRGQHLPPGHPARFGYFKNVWVLGKLAFGTAVVLTLAWGARRRVEGSPDISECSTSAAPGLAVAVAAVAAGYALGNSAAVTGLEFENFHWVYVEHSMGEVVLLAGFALLWDRYARRPPPAVLVAVPALLVLLALVWRPYEALRGPEPAHYAAVLRSLAPIRPALARLTTADVLAGPPEANVAILFGRPGQLFQYNQTSHSSVVPDSEVHERYALSGWLNGLSLDEFQRRAPSDRFNAGPLTDSSWRPEALAATREALFRALLDGRPEGRALLDRYRPTVLLRPAAAGEPPRGGPWSLDATGGDWSLWRRSGGRRSSLQGQSGKPLNAAAISDSIGFLETSRPCRLCRGRPGPRLPDPGQEPFDPSLVLGILGRECRPEGSLFLAHLLQKGLNAE
jgi:hypothetical protein